MIEVTASYARRNWKRLLIQAKKGAVIRISRNDKSQAVLIGEQTYIAINNIIDGGQ